MVNVKIKRTSHTHCDWNFPHSFESRANIKFDFGFSCFYTTPVPCVHASEHATHMCVSSCVHTCTFAAIAALFGYYTYAHST